MYQQQLETFQEIMQAIQDDPWFQEKRQEFKQRVEQLKVDPQFKDKPEKLQEALLKLVQEMMSDPSMLENANRIGEQVERRQSLATLLLALNPSASDYRRGLYHASSTPVMQVAKKNQPVTWDQYLGGGFVGDENAQLAGMMDDSEEGNMDKPIHKSTTEGDLPTWGEFEKHEDGLSSHRFGGGLVWADAGLSSMPKDFQSQLGYPAAGTAVTPEQEQVLKKIGVFDALVAKGGLTKS